MFKKQEHNNSININLTPLINIVFLLLLFFIVAGKLNSIDDGDVSLPISQSEIISEENIIDIMVDVENNIFVSDVPVSINDLNNAISLLLLNNPDKIITIKADNNVSGTKLIDIMNVIEASGGKNIALMTKSR